VFREFPYLYAGSLAYEESISPPTPGAPQRAVIVRDGGRVVGASTGLPLVAETAEFARPSSRMATAGGDLLLRRIGMLREYRGRGLYREFFAGANGMRAPSAGFRWMALCGVVRPENHPGDPPTTCRSMRIWQKFGYTRSSELVTQYEWQDLDETAPSAKDMLFWLKAL